MQVNTQQYIQESLTLSQHELELAVKINNWLPNTIIDMHTHANGSDAVQNLSPYALRQVRSSFPDFSIKDSEKVDNIFHPGKKIIKLRFSNPYKGINHRLANQYLLNECPSDDKIILCGIPDDINYTVKELQTDKYVGLKLYPFYFEPPAEMLSAFLPREVLQVAEHLDLPLILHLPKSLINCIDQVTGLAIEYPKLKIILAHYGTVRVASAHSLKAFYECAKFKNIFADMSTIVDVDVHRQVLQTLGFNKVLYGSDEPMNLLRFIQYKHPQLGMRFVSDTKYHWLDEKQYHNYRYLAKKAINIHWQVLSAFIIAMEENYSGTILEQAKNMIFLKNSKSLFLMQKGKL